MDGDVRRGGRARRPNTRYPTGENLETDTDEDEHHGAAMSSCDEDYGEAGGGGAAPPQLPAEPNNPPSNADVAGPTIDLPADVLPAAADANAAVPAAVLAAGAVVDDDPAVAAAAAAAAAAAMAAAAAPLAVAADAAADAGARASRRPKMNDAAKAAVETLLDGLQPSAQYKLPKENSADWNRVYSSTATQYNISRGQIYSRLVQYRQDHGIVASSNIDVADDVLRKCAVDSIHEHGGAAAVVGLVAERLTHNLYLFETHPHLLSVLASFLCDMVIMAIWVARLNSFVTMMVSHFPRSTKGVNTKALALESERDESFHVLLTRFGVWERDMYPLLVEKYRAASGQADFHPRRYSLAILLRHFDDLLYMVRCLHELVLVPPWRPTQSTLALNRSLYPPPFHQVFTETVRDRDITDVVIPTNTEGVPLHSHPIVYVHT